MQQDGKVGFAPNKRAIFSRAMYGHNMGKIVRLVCEFPDMDAAPVGAIVMDPTRSIQWIKGEKCAGNRTWIVESLGEPIIYVHNGQLVGHASGPVPEYYLTPLDDFEQDEGLWEADTVSTEAPEPIAA